MLRKLYLLPLILLIALEPLQAMHIMEGYLPLGWCIFWYAVSVPFVFLSYRFIAAQVRRESRRRVDLALASAFVFILSALKLPSVTGSSSHLTGTTLGTLTVGVMAMPLIGTIVLIFQSLLLAHGGISTLGANVFSLAIIGPLAAYLVYVSLSKVISRRSIVVFVATFIGSMATYVTTSIQLAIVFPDPEMGFVGAVGKFLGIFAVTQLPLSVLEAIITVGVIELLEGTRRSALAVVDRAQTLRTLGLSLLALVCLALPVVGGYVDFGSGADDQAGEMVEALATGYEPTPFFEGYEPSEAAEPWLFALQVGIGILIFALAYRAIRRRSKA